MQVPITISNISISGKSCMNVGFRVTNCHLLLPMKLQPNDTAELKIAFALFRFSSTRLWHTVSKW